MLSIGRRSNRCVPGPVLSPSILTARIRSVMIFVTIRVVDAPLAGAVGPAVEFPPWHEGLVGSEGAMKTR